jgi:hypothetical protein
MDPFREKQLNPMNGAGMIPPLIFDDQRNEPGLHALIVGVSSYPYLAGGVCKPAKEPMLSLSTQLKQLSGPAQSAKDLANFLTSRKDKLIKPLRTLRLLASPGVSEAGPAFDGVLPATADNVTKALSAWQKDACRSNEEVTLFYFGGHGSQLNKRNALLLLEDFLGGLTVFDRTIEVSDIWYGMAVSTFVPNIAQTQFYFIDACRVDYKLYREIQRTGTCSPFVIQDLGPDQRVAPIFFAAGPGQDTKAYPDLKTTRFGQRLLRCLVNDGAEQIKKKWVVTVGQLSKALSKLSNFQNLSSGATIDSFDIDQWSNEQLVIHTLDGPPTVKCTFRFEPDDARKGVALILESLMPKTPTRVRFSELHDPQLVTAGIYTMASDPEGLFPKGSINIQPPFMDILIEPGEFSWA